MNVTKSQYSKPGFFHLWVGEYEVSVQRLCRPSDVVYMADDRLKGAKDARRQQTFSDVSDALRFIGYPVDFLGIPSELVIEVQK